MSRLFYSKDHTKSYTESDNWGDDAWDDVDVKPKPAKAKALSLQPKSAPKQDGMVWYGMVWYGMDRFVDRLFRNFLNL